MLHTFLFPGYLICNILFQSNPCPCNNVCGYLLCPCRNMHLPHVGANCAVTGSDTSSCDTSTAMIYYLLSKNFIHKSTHFHWTESLLDVSRQAGSVVLLKGTASNFY